jgi:Hint domain
VLTASGAIEPIRWVGRRAYSARFIAGNRDVPPVCIRAGALADDLPRRDLWVSPLHAMFLDGVLVPAIDLVNGVTIVQPDPVDSVEYFHIELRHHDVILAEGAPSESFVDDDSRMMFQNVHEYAQLYPGAVREPARYCAPRLTHGYALEAIRERLAVRAGVREAARVAALRGFVDFHDSEVVEGWAQNPEFPEAPVCVDVLVEGKLVAQTLANRYRADLAAAGIGSGRHSFSIHLPSPLTPRERQSVEVRRSSDRSPLPHSEIAAQA